MTTASTALVSKKLKVPESSGLIAFGIALVIGVAYIGTSIAGDLGTVKSNSILPFLLLGVALLTALAFEFVNGFVCSGMWNFIGVLVSSGAGTWGPGTSDCRRRAPTPVVRRGGNHGLLA